MDINKLPKRNELLIDALMKSESKWHIHERNLQLYLLNKFEQCRIVILNMFYSKYMSAITNAGTCTPAECELRLTEFKGKEQQELLITQESLCEFGPVSMVDGIFKGLIQDEIQTIQTILTQSGFTKVQVKGGFSNKGPNGAFKYAYIHSINAY